MNVIHQTACGLTLYTAYVRYPVAAFPITITRKDFVLVFYGLQPGKESQYKVFIIMYNTTCTYNSKYNSQCPLNNKKRRKKGQMKLNYKYLHCKVP